MQPLTDEQRQTVEENYGLAWRAASRIGQKSGLTFEERLSAAGAGLIIAVKKFDPDRGAKLSTYANYWMKREIIEEIVGNHLIFLPHYHNEERGQGHRFQPWAHQSRRIVGIQRPKRESGAKGEGCNEPEQESRQSVREREQIADRARAMGDLLADLEPRERDILLRHYFDGQSLVEIAKAHRLTRERIRQIKECAMSKIRTAITQEENA